MASSVNQFSFLNRYISGEAHNTFWSFFARGIGYANTAITIYALTIYQYGVFQLLMSSYSFFTYFIAWGGFAAGTEIIRLVGEGNDGKAKRLFWEFNIFRAVNAFALWAGFFWGANLPIMTARYGPDAIMLIKILSFLFLSEFFLSTVKSILSMHLKFEYLAARSAIGKFFQLGILLFFYFYSHVGLIAIMFSVVAAHFLSAISLTPLAFRLMRDWRSVEMAPRGVFWSVVKTHGKWSSARGFVGQLSSRIEPWLIKIFIGTEAVGIYGVASQMVDVFVNIVPTSTLGSLIPRIASEKERAKKIFVRGVKYLIIINTLVMFIGWAAAPVGIYLFFQKYSSALPYFFALLAGMPLRIGQISDLLLVSYRDQKFFFFRSLTRNFGSIVLMLVLLPIFGLWGLVLNDILLGLAITQASYMRLIYIRPEFKLTWKSIFSWDDEDTQLLKKTYTGILKLLPFRA